MTLSNITTSTEFEESLALDLEAPANLKDGYAGSIYSGYFKAPATARYRFYISCDDACQIWFSNVNMNPLAKKLIYQANSYVNFRQYFFADYSRTTAWLNLTKDEYYYIETRQVNYNGGDHISVAVEIDDPQAVPNHFHTQREIQRLFVNQDITREKWNITIDKPDGGTFVLNLKNPKDNTMWSSSPMDTLTNAYDFAGPLRTYYRNVWGTYIDCQRYLYDVNGTLTTQLSQVAKAVYTIVVYKSLPSVSANAITVTKVSTGSGVTITLPRDYQVSNPPM